VEAEGSSALVLPGAAGGAKRRGHAPPVPVAAFQWGDS